MISLGGDGAVLACKEGFFYAKPPTVKVRSTIGAGDSMLAGFIDGTLNGFCVGNVLKRATAYGTAACMQEGTLPPKQEDIKKLEGLISIKSL